MLSKNIKHVGVNDHQIDLFEGQYTVPNGLLATNFIGNCIKFIVDFYQTWVTN